MCKQFILTINVLQIILLLITMWLQPGYAATKYTLSVTPRFSSQEILTRLGPLSKLLSEKLHSEVEIILAADFNDYEERLRTGQFDIAFSNPVHYSKASTIHEVIAMEKKHEETHIHGIIITRADSDIKSVTDLVNKSVSVVSFTSAGGFLSQKVFLEEQKINPKTQLKLQEAHDNKQENVILSVYHGDVSAGFINEDALHIVDRYLPLNSIKVIASTARIPGWAFSVKRSLPEMVKARISQVILELDTYDPTLKAMQLQNLVAATDSDYDVVRQALEIKPTPPVTTEIKPIAPPQCSPTLPPVLPSAVVTTVPPVTTVKPVPVPVLLKEEAQTAAKADITQQKYTVKKTKRKVKKKNVATYPIPNPSP